MTKTKVLIIYTGGTIGMMQNSPSESLRPFDFESIQTHIPELKNLETAIETISFTKPFDSSNVQPSDWKKLAEIIQENYKDFDGFVVLHGSDTMAYSGAMLSFMLENLCKPVIFTGSQIPIGHIRTDAKEHIITALEIAGNKELQLGEVCIYFDYQLFRANRTTKRHSAKFEAFVSPNYPALAEAGTEIVLHQEFILKRNESTNLKVHTQLDNRVASLKLFPGMMKEMVESVLRNQMSKAIILESFGSGNAFTDKWFLNLIAETIERGIPIFNITQCTGGRVIQGKYETSRRLKELGVVGGADIIYEAALAKLMYLMGKGLQGENLKREFRKNYRGEITEARA